jgi:hypothetical protein
VEKEHISREYETAPCTDRIIMKPNDDDIAESSEITNKEDMDGIVPLSRDSK